MVKLLKDPFSTSSMVGGPVGFLANPLTRLLGLGSVFAWLCLSATLTAEAGCGFHASSHPSSFTTQHRHGELSLKLYVQYSAGGTSYSFFSPVPPCSGPHCGAKPRMKPIGTNSWIFRLSGSFATDSVEKQPRVDANRDRNEDHPQSVYAPRGSIATMEHPPKLCLE
jgi:hypothetical protein